jgi:hypothetical protein
MRRLILVLCLMLGTAAHAETQADHIRVAIEHCREALTHVRLGMLDSDIASMCETRFTLRHVNSTVTTAGLSEQWVYFFRDPVYLYFEDHRLVAMQGTR